MERKDDLLEKQRLRERFRIAVKFFLNCFDSMHFLEMTEAVCYPLEDVRTFLMSMRSSSRSKEFSEIPGTTMNELGYLKKTTVAKLNLAIVSKEELLLLFVVYHLSLNGKSHFVEVVEDLNNRAPKVVSMVLSCASVTGKIGYLKKYPQFFKVDDAGNLELLDTFNLKFDDESSGGTSSSMADGIEDSVVICTIGEARNNVTETRILRNNTSDSAQTLKLHGINPSLTHSEYQESSLSCDSKSNKAFAQVTKNENNISGEKTEEIKISSVPLNQNNQNDEKKVNIDSENNYIVPNCTPITTFKMTENIFALVRGGIMFLCEQIQCRIDMHLFCVVLHALLEAKRLFECLSLSQQMALTRKVLESLWTAAVEDCSGSVPRPSVEAHGLDKKQKDLLFISFAVSQSEELHCITLLQMFEDFQRDTTELMQSDVYFNGDVFSIDKDGCIKFENFPPAKWLAEALSSTSNTYSSPIAKSGMPDKDDFDAEPLKILSSVETQSSKAIEISNEGCTVDNGDQGSDTVEERQRLEYSEDSLNTLVLKIAESITYLSQFFELNICSGLLEVVLHVWKDCAVFFGLPVLQQMEVVIKSFSTFHIDGYGRVFPIFPKQLGYTSSKIVRMLFCMSHLIIQRGRVHFKELFILYSQYVGETTYYNDLSQFHFFKSKEDIFFMSSDGYVSLANVSTVKFNFVSVIMSNRNKNIPSNTAVNTTRPVFANACAVLPRPVLKPQIFVRKSFVPQIICTPSVYIAPTPIVNYAPIVVPGGVLPNLYCNPVFPNSGRLVQQKTSDPVFNSRLIENGDIIPVPLINTSNKDTCPVSEKSLTIDISSVQSNTIANSHCSKEGTSTQSKEDEEMAKRIEDSALFLSQCFVFETEDFVLIVRVLKDVEQYLNKLPERIRTDFIAKCIENYFRCSSDIVSSAASLADCCTVSDEEKIALFGALLLSREKELHYTKIFSMLFQYNLTDTFYVKSALNQYVFFTKWNRIFSVSNDGNVKLLQVFKRNNETLSSDEAFIEVSDSEVSTDQNDGFDIESKDEIKDLPKKISRSKNKLVIIKAKNINIASRCYNRIIASIMYLSKTLEDISAEQVMMSIFYVLSDVRGLFAQDSRKGTMIALQLQFCEGETLLANHMACGASYLKEKETISLALVCLLIKSRKMNYQQLFCALESEDKSIKRIASAEQLAFIAKKKFFMLEDNDDVSLKEFTYFDLGGYFDGDNLNPSLRAESGEINYIFEGNYRKFKSSPNIIQHDLLFRIHQICKSALSLRKQTECHEKSSLSFFKSSTLDSSSSVKPEPKNQILVDTNSVRNKTPGSPNGTNSISLKSTDTFNGYPIEDNPTTGPKYKFSLVCSSESARAGEPFMSESTQIKRDYEKSLLKKDDFFNSASKICHSEVLGELNKKPSVRDYNTDVQGHIDTDVLTYSTLVPITSSVAQGLDNQNFSSSIKERSELDTIKNTEPIFNLLEVLSDLEKSEVPPVKVKSISCLSVECDGSRDSTKEQRTKNFFIVILSQSLIGFPVSVLKEKVLLASREVQHYISCVYKGDILAFLQNYAEFHVSHTSGNVCCMQI